MEYLKNRIQTIQVDNTEVKVEMPYENICIRNNGENTVYASVNPNITAYADGVLEIKPNEYKVLRDCYKVSKGEAVCYIKCADESYVEVESANDVNFFSRKTVKGGGGGEPVDTYTKEQIDYKLSKKTQDVHLYSDGTYIGFFSEKDDDEPTVLTYEDVKSIIENETNNVYLTNGYYSFHTKYIYKTFISGQEVGAIGFIGETQLNDNVYSYRVIINENNEVKDDEIKVAKYSDLNNKEDNGNKVTSLSSSSTDTQYPSAKVVYNELLNKVGKNDFATKTAGGTVKIDSGYGIEIDTNGTLKTTPAYDNFLQNFADDNHVITPYRFKKAMGLFGINSQTQVADMQAEIDSKVDDDEFVADNMIKFPYQTVPDSIVGATLSVDNEGVITINGNTSRDSSGINLYTHFSLKDGVYTICANSGSTAFGVRVYGKKIGSETNETLFSTYGNNPYTFIVGESGFEGYEDFSINGRVTYATSFDNITMKPMLEKGSVAHSYQPYKLSRQALRDDIDRILTTLNLTQEA